MENFSDLSANVSISDLCQTIHPLKLSKSQPYFKQVKQF